ncbi:unnamed protein product, partial [Symbiodinium necroappetens]
AFQHGSRPRCTSRGSSDSGGTGADVSGGPGVPSVIHDEQGPRSFDAPGANGQWPALCAQHKSPDDTDTGDGGGSADRQRQRMGPGSPACSSASVSAAQPPVEPGQGLGPGRSGGAVDDEARRSVVHQPGAGDRGLAPDEEGPAGAAHPSPQDLDAETLGGLDADKDGSCDAVRALHPA